MKGNYSAGFMSWQPPSASQRHIRTCPPLSLPMLAIKLTGDLLSYLTMSYVKTV